MGSLKCCHVWQWTVLQMLKVDKSAFISVCSISSHATLFNWLKKPARLNFPAIYLEKLESRADKSVAELQKWCFSGTHIIWFCILCCRPHPGIDGILLIWCTCGVSEDKREPYDLFWQGGSQFLQWVLLVGFVQLAIKCNPNWPYFGFAQKQALRSEKTTLEPVLQTAHDLSNQLENYKGEFT